MRRIGVTLLVMSGVIIVAARSAAPAQTLQFGAASVKPVAWQPGQYHGGDCHGTDSKYRPEVSTRPTPIGRCAFPNTVLGNIIHFAYQEPGRPSLRISGGDKWIGSDAFDVEATAENPEEATEEQLRHMLQTLLRDRFKLQFHREIHDERGFALIRVGQGRNLKASTNNGATGPIYIRREGAQLIVTGRQVTMDSLINFLGGEVQQPVQDETRLDGVYDIELRFTATDATANTTNPGLADPSGPSLFTALQEQLGLHLQPRRVPVEVFVIDHAERPSPD
jgi:uncharacterized protein (TIGR03435 family)